MKKVIASGLSLIMAVVMCVSLLPVTALAADSDFVIVDGVFLNAAGTKVDGVLASYKGTGGHVVIPDGVKHVGYYLSNPFANNTAIISIEMPDSVETIGSSAFRRCTNLTSVTFGNGIKQIFDVAFSHCDLRSIDIPDSVTNIGNEAFVGNTNLASVTLGNSVETIGVGAFRNCTSLKSITIPESVRRISEGAFADTGITSITIPQNTYIVGSSTLPTFPTGTIVHGVAGSPAETYAEYWGFTFVAIDSTIPTDPINPPVTTEKPTAWAEEQVTAAISNNLVPQDLQAKYTQATTRAEFAALAVALYEQVTGKEITERQTFSDTTDINVQKAAAIGVVNGVGNNMFSPDTGLTREQAAVMLSRLADAIGKPLAQQAATFADNGSIATWAIEQVGQIQAAEIMGGVGNNTFSPQGAYTREQSIVTIMRLYDVVK